MTLHADWDMEMGSWDDVRASGIKLLLWCRLPFEPGGPQRTGGWITSGVEDGIILELMKARDGSENGIELGTERETNVVDVE